MTTPFCVCVPAKNEAERLPRLIAALAAQTVAAPIPISICVNNSDDGSEEVLEGLAACFVGTVRLHVDVCSFAPDLAHAGSARGRAMAAGAKLTGNRGVLISTDADCRPPQRWIEATLAAIDGGADIVGGRIVIDDAEPQSPTLVRLRAAIDRYWARVREIEDAIDPCPWDRPPRHGDHTGASLAVDTALFLEVGGVPTIATGEDRALVRRAMAAGGRLAHPETVWTRVSPRTEGRAAGGMAEEMARLAVTAGNGAMPRLPDFAHWQARAEWRRDRRSNGVAIGDLLAEEDRLPPMPADMVLDA